MFYLYFHSFIFLFLIIIITKVAFLLFVIVNPYSFPTVNEKLQLKP